MTQTWLIIGATSSIARAFARAVSETGAAVLLAGRDLADLERSATDCEMRGARLAEALSLDLRVPEGFGAIIERLEAEEGTLNVAMFAGSMPV